MSSFGRSTITTNPVTDKLRRGQPSVGSWLTLCSPVAAESMAQVGWEWLVVDAEHSPVGFETMVHCFRAIQRGGAVPMVHTVVDARAVVSNMRYATKGQRSFGGSRVAPYIDGD